MTRVPPISEDCDNDSTVEVERQDKRRSNLRRVLAHHPEAARQFESIGLWFRHEGLLNDRLRELAIIQVGYTTDSAYILGHHLELAETYGVTEDDLGLIVGVDDRQSNTTDSVDLAVIEMARELTLRGAISDSHWDTIERTLGVPSAIELVLLISFYNHHARVVSALQIPLENKYAQVLAAHQLPKNEVG
jgi:alkylhydroperoxidase family enzyme